MNDDHAPPLVTPPDFDVAIMRLRPGDVLVLRYTRSMVSAQHFAVIQQYMERIAPGIPFLLLDNAMQLDGVLRPPTPPMRKPAKRQPNLKLV